ncbi:MAG: type II secretion system minor pseudopilin GspI [Aeromonas sp.]|nr:type II secretion system minor pseudopilin GspI [Aeromonas sp.]MBP9569522.1 type II secretion system minor pseudopilin GspI [Aeromonadaceae bacterium]
MSCRGMTLLEVMVALAIFAVAGIAVMSSVSQQLVGLTALEEKTIATWVADNRQVEVKLRKNWPGLSWTNGKEEMAGQTWYWRWRGVETQDSSFRALDVEVRSEEKAKDPRVTLRTYVSR